MFNASTPKNLTSSTIFHPQESHIVSGNELSLSAFIFFPMGPGCCHAAAEPPGGAENWGRIFSWITMFFNCREALTMHKGQMTQQTTLFLRWRCRL